MRARFAILFSVAAVGLVIAFAPGRAGHANPEGGPYHVSDIVSTSTNGVQGNQSSGEPVITDDGRFIFFASTASNLDSADNDDPDQIFPQDIFRKDVITGQTDLVSLADNDSAPKNNSAQDPRITGDGRYVLFTSNGQLSSEVTPNQAFFTHLWVRDLSKNTTTLIDRNGTTPGDGSIFGSAISADGDWFAFMSSAGNLTADNTNTCPAFGGSTRPCFEIFRANRDGQVQLVSKNNQGVPGDGDAIGNVAISGDGRFVVYTSYAGNLTPNDSNQTDCGVAGSNSIIECPDVFLFDSQTSTTTLISKSPAGERGDSSSYEVAITADARFIAFSSNAGNLLPNDANNFCDNNGDTVASESCSDVFRLDMTTGDLVLVSVTPEGVSGIASVPGDTFSGGHLDMTPDGRYVSFVSDAADLVDGYDPRCHLRGSAGLLDCNQIFVRDMDVGVTALVSKSAAGVPDDGGASFGDMTPDGRTVAFTSGADNLTPNDTGPTCGAGTIFTCFDVFVAEATHSLTGDVNCDYVTDPFDALQIMRFKSGAGVQAYAWCPELNTMTGFPSSVSAEPQGGILRLFGDVNCSGAVDIADAVFILQFYSFLNPRQPLLCPPIGPLPGTNTPGPTVTPTPTDTALPSNSATAIGTASPTPTKSPTPTPTNGPSPTTTFVPPDNDCSNVTPLAIPDGTGDYDLLTFDFSAVHHTIAAIYICVNLDHTLVGDLVISLRHVETDKTVRLVDRIGKPAHNGNCSGHNGGLYLILDDFESQTTQQHCTNATTSEFQGAFKPDSPLSAFNGEDINGQWQVVITDEKANGKTGTLRGGFFTYFYTN